MVLLFCSPVVIAVDPIPEVSENAVVNFKKVSSLRRSRATWIQYHSGLTFGSPQIPVMVPESGLSSAVANLMIVKTKMGNPVSSLCGVSISNDLR